VPPGPGEVPAGEAAASQNTGQTASDDSTDPVTKPAEETEKPEKATRRRRGGPLASATAEPGGPRRPGNKAPAKRGGTRRPPNTERSAPAVEAADAVPAEPATEPSVTDTSTPTEPAETSETVPEPSVDSKPAGDASPTDPRNEQTEGEK
jgi:NADH-quinone oxidoreductase subunit E